MKLYAVVWVNGHDYEDGETDVVALFSNFEAAERFAGAATREAGRLLSALKDDYLTSEILNKYDVSARSALARGQRYIAFKQEIPVNPVIK